MQIVPALHTFEAQEGLTLTFRGESVQVLYPGAAHPPDNVVVYFPVQGLLFGGCMIRAASAKLGYTGDTDAENWAAAVRSIEPFAPRIVILGHGDRAEASSSSTRPPCSGSTGRPAGSRYTQPRTLLARTPSSGPRSFSSDRATSTPSSNARAAEARRPARPHCSCRQAMR
jgi:glyoxylase-like metal-dependent hydrolase (beta-lactamase superfamily II)